MLVEVAEEPPPPCPGDDPVSSFGETVDTEVEEAALDGMDDGEIKSDEVL